MSGPSMNVSSINAAEEEPLSMIQCQVCGSMIDINAKKDQHVVRCEYCNEATPIRDPPPGQKYIRCPCNCLLICKSTAQRISCPRQSCHKIIVLYTPTSKNNSTSDDITPGVCVIDSAATNPFASPANQCQQQEQLKFRVGYWWSEKKSQKLNVSELTALFAERQCQFVKINLDRPIEEQGPFSLIVHKISDILVKADHGDASAKKTISAFESYVRKHPETVILDPLDNNRALLDRYKQYRLIEQSGLTKEGVVFTPSFVHFTSTNMHVNKGRIRRSKLTFPLVCKPILAQGSTGAHQMCIIFNEAGLKDVKPPCVAQSFVNHNARLFKLFVIKDKYYVTERPSLKNFQADDRETVFFYSHDISKPNSSSSLTELDETDKIKLENELQKMRLGETDMNMDVLIPKHYNNDIYKPSDEMLSKIVKTFSERLGLTFYGIDIIIEIDTMRYAIIDMNTFPGYDGVENFLTIFRDVVCEAIPKDADDQGQMIRVKSNKRKPTEIDSGIEST